MKISNKANSNDDKNLLTALLEYCLEILYSYYKTVNGFCQHTVHMSPNQVKVQCKGKQ